MILSFHPCFVGDRNILCAGRQPDDSDLEAISAASAVVLPQGCRSTLYRMARKSCALVFPNYDARFSFPGKTGQIQLFQEATAPHPNSRVFNGSADYRASRLGNENTTPIGFPMVVKLDWGGEGDTVFFVESQKELDDALDRVQLAERSGDGRFIIQEYVPGRNRSLRVAVIGQSMYPYWRAQPDSNRFYASLAGGGEIDYDSDPELMSTGVRTVRALCDTTGINLAGLDLIFSEGTLRPLFIEINYFFGRRGLGGSESFYAILDNEIRQWLTNNGLSHPKTTGSR